MKLGIELLNGICIDNLYFDYSKTHRELGPPQVDMQQSLEDTYRWYLDNGYIQPHRQADLITTLGRGLGLTDQSTA